MRVTNIDLYASDNLIMNFSFRDPRLLDQYLVKGVTGLDAESIVPKVYGRSFFYKLPYYNMVMEPRTIVFRLAINPLLHLGQSYSNLRDYLYRVISSSRTGQIELMFNDDNDTVATVKGRITKFEASLSTQQPELQISIYCKDPRLQSPNQVDVDTDTLATEFPFVSTISDNLSTAPHGCVIQFLPNPDADYFQIEGGASDVSGFDWFFKVQPGTIDGVAGFVPGDLITIYSEPGQYYVRLNRSGGHEYSIADKIVVGSVWPVIFFGENSWETAGIQNWIALYYHNTYWGV